MSVQEYVELVNGAPGIMRPGLDADSFGIAVKDDRTLFIEGTGIPIAVPVQYYPWIRTEYFRDQGVDTSLYVYVGWPDLWKSLSMDSAEAHAAMLRQLATDKYALVVEQSGQRDVRSLLESAFKQVDSKWYFKDLHTAGTLPGGKPTEYRTDHHIYETRYASKGKGGESAGAMTDVYDSFSTDGVTELAAQLRKDEVSKTYAEYIAAFRETRRHGAVDAVIPEEDFDHWMQSPQFLKFIQRDSKGIVNMCVLTSVRNIDYMQTRYFEKHASKQFIRDEVLCCPIVYSRHGAPKNSGRKTAAGIARSFKAARKHPRLVVECNDVSDKYIPRILKEGTASGGLELVAEPALVQSVELAMVR